LEERKKEKTRLVAEKANGTLTEPLLEKSKRTLNLFGTKSQAARKKPRSGSKRERGSGGPTGWAAASHRGKGKL